MYIIGSSIVLNGPSLHPSLLSLTQPASRSIWFTTLRAWYGVNTNTRLTFPYGPSASLPLSSTSTSVDSMLASSSLLPCANGFLVLPLAVCVLTLELLSQRADCLLHGLVDRDLAV